MLVIALHCTHPQTLTFLSGKPLPVKTDCTSSSYGELSISGKLRNGSRFTLKQNAFEVVRDSKDENANYYLKIDVLAASTEIKYEHILTVDLYGNLTLNRVTRVVGIEFDEMCAYGAERLAMPTAGEFQYYIFPKSFSCSPFNFSFWLPSVYYSRHGYTGETRASYMQQDGYYMSFKVQITDAQYYTTLSSAYLSFWFGNFTIDLSRTADEAAKDSNGVQVQYKHCFDQPENIVVLFSEYQIAIRAAAAENCYLNGPLYLKLNISPDMLPAALQQSEFYEPFFRYQAPTGTTLDTTIIETLKLFTVLPEENTDQSSNVTAFNVSTALANARQVTLCNMELSEFVAEKVYFNESAQIYPRSDAKNLCSPLYGVKMRFPREIIKNLDAELPLVMLHRKPPFSYVAFDLDSEWMHYDRYDTLELSTGEEISIAFTTPKTLQNCLFLAEHAVARGDELLLLLRQVCDGASTAIDGYSYISYNNYRNARASEPDMYFGVVFSKSGHTPVPGEELTSQLSEHYRFTRKISADTLDAVQEFEYITAEQQQAALAEIAEFEAHNYIYTDWVRSHWWIFFLTVLLTVALGFTLLYGCRYPCLYCLIPDARRQLRASAEERKTEKQRQKSRQRAKNDTKNDTKSASSTRQKDIVVLSGTKQ